MHPSASQHDHILARLNEALALQGSDLRGAIEIAETTYQSISPENAHGEAAALKCRAAYVLGSLLRLAGTSYERAEELLLSALHPSMDAQARRGLFGQLGQLYLERDDLEKASEYLTRALEEAREASHPLLRADAMLNLANLRVRRQDPTAKDLYEEALSIYYGYNNEEGIAITLTNYGMLFHQSGRSEEALDTLTRAAGIFDSIQQTRSKGIVLHKIATVQLALGDLASAASAVQSSLDIAEREQLLALRVEGLRLYADIKDRVGECEAATELREEADALNAAIGRA